MMIRAAIPLLLAALIGCASTPGEVPGDIAKYSPQISRSIEGNPFVSLVFAIVSRTPTPDGGQRLLVIGHDGDFQVGFALVLSPAWPTSSASGRDLNLRKGTVTFESVGVPSRRFVQALDRLFTAGTFSVEMKASSTFDAISLSGDPTALDRAPVKMKLFYAGDSDPRHAEWYLTIDAGKSHIGRVDLDEVDLTYRRAIIVALAAD
jgi:hypothetical protein